MKDNKEQIVRNYVSAYNRFDVDGMIENLDEHIRFENVSGGVQNMMLTGLDAFRTQAETASKLFSQRKQTIDALHHRDDEIEIEISYEAILATDLPNGMKKGDNLSLQGRSLFRFNGEKIVAITDIS